MITKNIDLKTPLPTIFPTVWKDELGGNINFASFRNVDHFKHTVSKLTQKKDNNCDITYKAALDKLLRGETDFPPSEQESIRNLVRSNLKKRGLITEEVYENFRYSVDGTAVGVDIGKYANGEPDCVITPSVQYVDFFYELYVSISYPWSVDNNVIKNTIAKLLATIEELERQHIFIKVTLIFPARSVKNNCSQNFFSSIPLFSHKDYKSVETMSAVLNDRLLRKFYFALLEDIYGDELASGYGTAITLPECMTIGESFDEIEFFTDIVKKVGS